MLLGALGPVMLRLAGERAQGTITFLAGPRTLGEHVVPLITDAARNADRAAPRVVAGLPIVVTAQPDRVRAQVATQYAPLAALPSYRSALDRDGFADGGGIVLAGTEEQVAAGLRRYADLGVTDALVSLVGGPGEQTRTLRLLAEITTPDRTLTTERT